MHTSTAFMTNHRVHDNFIINQGGDGILIGHYTCGENWVYNNVIVNAGLSLDPAKPDQPDKTAHCGIDFDSGDAEFPGGTVIHCVNNTIFGCGRPGSKSGGSGSVQFTGLERYTLDFSNNIVASTGEPFLSSWSRGTMAPRPGHNLWFGPKGLVPPAWDTAPIVANPQFVDAAHADFRLLPSSRAFGPPVGKPVLGDFDGLPRPTFGLSALGAFEPAR